MNSRTGPNTHKTNDHPSLRYREGAAAACLSPVHADAMERPSLGDLKFWICVGLLISVFCMHAGCSKSGKSGSEYVASIDGEKIYFEEFDQRFQAKLSLMRKNTAYSEAQTIKLKKEYLDEVIDEKLMLRRARTLGVTVSDRELGKKIDEIKADYPKDGFTEMFKDKEAFQGWREELRKRMVLEKLIGIEVNDKITVSDEEARALFNSQPSGWTSEDNVRVSQIVLPDRQKAEEGLRRLKAGADFSALAKEVSTGPEGAKGGDLGFFARGVLPEYFDRIIFSLEPGKFSGIVETPYGFHIFKVIERNRKKTTDFADVRSKIKEKLKGEKEEKAYELWLAKLRSETSITLNQAALERAGQKQ